MFVMTPLPACWMGLCRCVEGEGREGRSGCGGGEVNSGGDKALGHAKEVKGKDGSEGKFGKVVREGRWSVEEG